MKEILNLRKQQSEHSKAITRLEQQIAEERLAVDKGGSLRELRLLEQDLEDERARLETLDRRIAVLEAEEARAANVSRLVDIDRQAEEAQAQEDATWLEVHDELDRAVARLYGARQRRRAIVNDFHQVALQVAPIYAVMNGPERTAAEALRAELAERGAALRAVGVGHYSGQSCVFEVGNVHAPDAPGRPERWSWLVQQALDGMDREHAAQQEREERMRYAESLAGASA